MWLHIEPGADGEDQPCFDGDHKQFFPFVLDLVADDYEIEERVVPITASQFWEAWAGTLKWWEQESRPTFTRFDNCLMSPDRFAEEMVRRLGLEPPK